jgi:hypothetical protein
MKQVMLYSKPDCHLCDIVKQVIAQVRQRREFELVVRNILDDPADFEKYRYEIPVVVLNGHEIARHRLSAAALESALDQLDDGQSG